jgi:glycosyltransferase involved in cell wall biosynthesis
MHKTADNRHILHLPKWYPHPADPQNGVFIRKQIESVKTGFHHSVLFVKSADQGRNYKIESQKEGHIETCMVFFREFNGPGFLKPLVHLIKYLTGFNKGLKCLVKSNGKPDLIHAHVLLRSGLLAWYYSWKFGSGYIISEHWSGFVTGAFNRKNLIYRSLSGFVFKRASKILVVSETLKSSLIKLGVSSQKTEIVPNVVEVREFIEKPKQVKMEGKAIILSVADLVDDIKKISEVIEAVADLSKQHNLEYWIVGDGRDRHQLEELAGASGLLGETVKFFGRKINDEVLGIISQCDFLVMNSVTETFSVVTAEALLAGKPVVATRCGGPEAFVNKTNGILIETGNRQELKNAINKMIDTHKNYDKKLLKSGIVERFGSDAVGLRMKAVYNEVPD